MSKKLDALLKEKQKRQKPIPDILSAAFPNQRDFILDPSRRKAAFVARRSGKSYMIGIYLLYIALTFPSVKCLYFGKTQDAARNVMWLHIIFELCERFNIPRKYNKTLQEVSFENNSIIKLTGADASDDQIEKALGGKYKLVFFDECQVIKHDLERWVKDRLGPAMIDQQGTIVMTGTAGDLMGHRFWYKVTKTDGVREPGWSVHTWKWNDNPTMANLIAKEIEEMKILNPKLDEDPGFKQEYLCQWVVETSGRIYKYTSEKSGLSISKDTAIITSLMKQEKKWKYIFGMDYGYEDDTALVVGAFYSHDPHCYIVDSFKKPKMITQEIAELIKEWKELYNPVFIVGDAQNKTLIETLRMTYRIPIVPAKKLGKSDHIAAMNSDFRTGKIKVIEANNKALIAEWDELVWSEKQRLLGIFKENPTKDNHLADACLYLHHFSKHFRATPEPLPDPSPLRTLTERQFKQSREQTYEPEESSVYDYMDNLQYTIGNV